MRHVRVLRSADQLTLFHRRPIDSAVGESCRPKCAQQCLRCWHGFCGSIAAMRFSSSREVRDE